MTTQFSFTRSEDGTETIVLLGSQGVRVLPDSHVNYAPIRKVLLEADPSVPESQVYALADAASAVAETLHRLSERVTIKGDSIYFDGDKMETRLTRHIIDMIKAEDDNYTGYVKFLENVKANPSKSGRKGLFAFLDRHDLMITEDGCFIGYKGVRDDGSSVTAGKEDVTVTLADGTVETHKGHIPNPVGATIEMPRSLVDGDREVACSVGLHVANYGYASGWSTRLLTVKVNPRDVVSVPTDSNEQKIRCHRYTVLEINEGRTAYQGTSWAAYDAGNDITDDLDDDYDDEEYADDGVDLTPAAARYTHYPW